MSIKLIFENPNPVGTRIDIYRGDEQIDRENLPEPIFTTTEAITEYVDETVIQNQTYYYVFKTTGPDDYKITRNIEVLAIDDKGVGADLLVFGNFNYGYYGTFEPAGFLTGPQIESIIGIPFGSAGSFDRWHKYSHEGKVKFVPNGCVGKGISYEQAVIAGLIDGKVFTNGIFEYRIRLMKGYDSTRNFMDDMGENNSINVESIDGFGNCEFNDLVYPISRQVPLSQRMQNVDSRLPTDTGLVSGGMHLCAEVDNIDTPTTVLCRGLYSGNGMEMAYKGNPSNAGTSLCFWPVIELVED